VPTRDPAPVRDTPATERDYLSLLGCFTAALLLALAVVYGVTEWKEARGDQLEQLDTAIVLSEKALDRFFVESQAQLRELSMDLAEEDGLDHLPAAQRLVKRYADLHPESIAVSLLASDGQVLVTSTATPAGGLPTMATYPSFQSFLYELGASKDLRLGRPLLGPLADRWVFPMRYPVRDASGRLTAVLEVAVPVQFLEDFWRTAPVTARASIGLLRDDGYLISRYPVPGGHGPEELYGSAGMNALRIYLLANQFPSHGYVEGENPLTGNISANAHMRLAHFPVTLFVTMPTSAFRDAWLSRVKAAYGLALAFALLGLVVYRAMAVRQRAWILADRKVQRAMWRSERRFRLLYETNLDAVLQTAIGGAVVAANPAACAMFGCDEETIKLLGRTGLVSATDPRFDELIARRGVDGHATGVVAMMRADGTPFEAAASSVMMTDDGEVYCSWVLHDVTERRVAEAAVAARIAAEDANRAKTEFIAHMSHELRTPLNAILGFSAVLQMDTRRALHPAHLLQVGHIRNAGTHLLAMISDLLDLSSMESGSVRLNVEPIDPWQLAMKAIRDLAARAEAAQVEVEIRPPLPTLGRMLGDPTRFSQIVLNLLSNAIKYNRPGGRARVTLRAHDGRLSLSFRDGGCGMAPAQLEALFQPFNRLGREGSNIEGTGIGLVITKRLVEQMGGTLRVSSQVDDGSEFEVDLPFERAESASRPALVAAAEALGADVTCSVLYIDDDPINRLLVKALLETRRDVRLRLAASGGEGLAAAAERRPDLVLSDMRMDGMNGLEVMRALRAQDELRGLRIVAVSASAMAAEIDMALAAGFDNYLTKPVVVEQLFQEVDLTLAQMAHLAVI
jgi:PAS domain S-box-containing protein